MSVLPRHPSAYAFITVKLKRKLQYRGHVRPQKIEDALHCLKYDLKNTFYDDVMKTGMRKVQREILKCGIH